MGLFNNGILRVCFSLIILSLLVGCDGANGAKQSAAPKVTFGSDLKINTASLPQWESGLLGSFVLQASGGTPPYTWSLKGALPQGITLSPNGVIAGTVILASGSSKSVSSQFEAIVTDSKGKTATSALSLIVVEASLKIVPVANAVCPSNACNVIVATAEGGTQPYHFQSDSFMEGPPPMGMIIDLNGALTGKTKKAGDYTIGVCVTDQVAASKCTKVNVKIEEGDSLDGVWQGAYSETSTSSYCSFSESGTKTFTITMSDEKSFSGTAEYSGASTPIGGGNCEGSSVSGSGTISGEISEGKISGSINYGDADVPFTATLDMDSLSGTYSYSTSSYGATLTGNGQFNLRKK